MKSKKIIKSLKVTGTAVKLSHEATSREATIILTKKQRMRKSVNVKGLVCIRHSAWHKISI
jgi:hypothetical protein